MTERDQVVASVLARAKEQGRRVYGVGPGREKCAELAPGRGVPADWLWLCVEGDARWSYLPEEDRLS